MKLKHMQDPVIQELSEQGFGPIVKVLMKADMFAPPPHIQDVPKFKRDLKHELYQFLSGNGLVEKLDFGLHYVIIDLQTHLAPVEVQNIKEEWIEGIHRFVKQIEKIHEHKDTIEPATVMDIMHLSEETLNHFYKAGIRYFEAHEFSKAGDVFLLITFLDHKRFSPWLLKGLCDKENGDYEVALQDFTMASIMDINSPMPYVYSAECCFALGRHQEAHDYLEDSLKAMDRIPNVEQTGLKSHVNKLKNKSNK